MADAGFQIKDEELQKRLSLMIDRSRDQSPVLKRVALVMFRSVMKNFNVGGRPKWKPLSEATRKRRGQNAKPLLDTGKHIRDTITQFSNDEIARVGPVAGPIPRVHQFGFRGMVRQSVRGHVRRAFGRQVRVRAHERTANVRIPARPYMLFQDEDRTLILELIRKHNMGE